MPVNPNKKTQGQSAHFITIDDPVVQPPEVAGGACNVIPQQVPQLKTPQARILGALMPQGWKIKDPTAWPVCNREQLSIKAGYDPISGSTTRVLSGIRATNKTSGHPHPGLIDLGLVEAETYDIDGVNEICYRITQLGIEAFQAHMLEVGELPPVKPKSVCTNLDQGKGETHRSKRTIQ